MAGFRGKSTSQQGQRGSSGRRPPSARPAGRPTHAARPVEPPTTGPVEITVETIGAKGDGIAHWTDALGAAHRLFVPQTLPGDRLLVRLTEMRGDGWATEPVTLLEEAPGRVEPACRHFGLCGGCTLQHLDAAAYGRWKVDQVRQALSRAGIDDVPFAPLVVTPPRSRRRAVLAAARRGRRMWIGFNERSSHRLVDIADCVVLDPALMDLIAPLRALLLDLLPDNHTLDVALTRLDDGVDMVLEGLPRPDLPTLEALGAFAGAHDLARLSWSRQPGAPREPIANRRSGVIRFGDVAVCPAPGGFLQASPAAERALVAAAIAGLPTDGGPPVAVADLFAGSGTLSFPLAAHPGVAGVTAVEGDPASVQALDVAARALPAGRVTASRRDLFRDPLTPAELNAYALVVFDPPRAGAAAQAAALAASQVPSVVAISCNPVSFARDARLLIDGGYRLERLIPVDQFLWSPHMELAAQFRR